VRVEVLVPSWLSNNTNAARLARVSQQGLAAAGHDVTVLVEPSSNAERIVLWGLGHPRAQELLREARGRGVTVIGWDLGVWKRASHFRVSINDAHPRQYVMAKARPLDRLHADGLVLRQDADPGGPVYLIGIGWKSADTYGEQPGAWEDRTLERIRAAWPGQRVIFRPKRGGGSHAPHGIPIAAPTVSIEQLLRGAAAVYCRHSNVAVDAIVAGVPAIAEDGAAAAVCPNEPALGRLPVTLPLEVRTAFLGNLAWFQWSEAEIARPACWAVIDDIVRSVP
jgi:hypothetical protein